MQELKRGDLMRLFEVALGFMEEGVLIVDNSGYVVFYNQTAGALEGLRPDQAIGRHIDELFVESSPMARALHQGLLGYTTDDLILTEFDENDRPVRIQTLCYPLHLLDRQVGVLRLTRDLALWAPELDERKASSRSDLAATATATQLEDGAAVLCGTGPIAERLQEATRRLRGNREPVFLWGPPGSGRSSLARLLHREAIPTGPLLTCDFRFRSATAQEVLFFGTDTASGVWQQALGGSLILENLHLASPRLQDHLVALLDEANAPHCLFLLPGDPREAVGLGLLHPSLVERAVASIGLPPLGERREDLPQICQYFLRRLNARLERRVFGLTPLAKEMLQHYAWPGGLRELQGVLESAMLLATGSVLTPEHLSPLLQQADQKTTPVASPFGDQDDIRAERRSQSDFRQNGWSAVQPQPVTSLPTPSASSSVVRDSASDIDTATTVATDTVVVQQTDEQAGIAPSEAPIKAPASPTATRTQRRRMGDIEKNMILDALQMTGNDLSLAAKQLHMRETTLRKRLEQYNIHLPDDE